MEPSRKLLTRPLLATTALVASVLLTACAGGTAQNDSTGDESGFDYGADQSAVDAAIDGLEPVTLRYQPVGTSPENVVATDALAFKDYVEERSNGQITLDIVWAQAIAPFTEVADALADGRLDIAYHGMIYMPQEYPEFDAINRVSHYVTGGPLTGEAAAMAVGAELGWGSEDYMQRLDDHGLQPIQALSTTGDYLVACNQPGTSLDDWSGRQLRIASSVQTEIAAGLDATPVSTEFTETFEALQRRTVDCAFTQATTAVVSGLLEVAPHVAHLTDTRMNSVYTGGTLAGSSFATLPLPYQQIVFDGGAALLNGNLQMVMQASADTVTVSQEAGGGVRAFEPDAAEAISSALDVAADTLISEDRLPADIEETIRTAAEAWTAVVSEMGYTDGGTYEELPDWYDRDTDFADLANAVFEATAVPHRPGN